MCWSLLSLSMWCNHTLMGMFHLIQLLQMASRLDRASKILLYHSHARLLSLSRQCLSQPQW